MVFSLLRKRRASAPARTASVAEAVRVYAVGDIHGRADLFLPLLEAIAADAAEARPASAVVVLLGDLIDRGADSRRVVELAMTPPLPAPFRVITLMGNHEQMMLDALHKSGAVAPWLAYGGGATVASYGIAPIVGAATPERVERLQADLAKHLPAPHRTFLAGLPSSWRCGDYFFAHAGLRPGIPIEQQRPNDLLWAGQSFLNDGRDHGAVVVHGHRVVAEPEICSNRIGIDTGAYCTGVLTCLILDGETRTLLQATAEGVRRSAHPLPQHLPA